MMTLTYEYAIDAIVTSAVEVDMTKEEWDELSEDEKQAVIDENEPEAFAEALRENDFDVQSTDNTWNPEVEFYD